MRYRYWPIPGILIIGILISLVVQNRYQPHTSSKFGAVTIAATPINTKADFYHVYSSGSIGYELFPNSTTTNPDGSLAIASFYVQYINLANHSETYSLTKPPLSNLNIGCIELGNKSFKTDPSIFSNGGFPWDMPIHGLEDLPTSMQALSRNSDSLSLQPLNSIQTTIQVKGNCQYIGTADGQNYWSIN